MSSQDRRFFESFAIVLGTLVLFTIVIYFVAHSISAKTQVAWSAEERARATDMAERIKPIGAVAVAGETPVEAAAPAPVAAAPAAAMSGEEIYNGTCFACHAVGVAGAPKLGDKADWAPRIAQGTETLVQHAINGFQGSKGVMPPKGGRVDYSDEAIASAVAFMVGKAQ